MTHIIDDYSGTSLESEVLGCCVGRQLPVYHPYATSLALVMRSQPKVRCKRAAALEALVSLRVGGSVVLYTAVGSSLDRFHGVDAVFVLTGEVVTLDLTLNRAKESGKADIVFNPNEEKWAVLIGLVAAEFAAKRRMCVNVWRAA